MVLHTMYFVDELHSAKQAAPPKGERSAAKELDLAKRLIESLASPFKPEQYEDEYRKNVERLLEEKHQGKKPTTVKQPKVAKVTNILEALQKSLQSSSKSAASSPATGKRTQAKARKKTATKRSRKVA
jgi:DNA end-binding protein Ku